MSKHTIPTELNIAPRGKSWLHGQLVDGEQGHPTRQCMESAERAQAIQCTCPSGDGSLQWPCPAHQPKASTLAAPAGAAKPASPTFMTADQGRDWAWNDVREYVGTEGWTVMDSVNFHGFFLYGWNYRGQYELQRTATRTAVMQEILSAAPAAVAVPAKLPTSDEIRAIARSVSTSSSDSPSPSEYVMAGYRAALAATTGDHVAEARNILGPRQNHLPNCRDDACLECSSLIPDEWVNKTPAAAPVVLPEPVGEAINVFKDREIVEAEWFGKPPTLGTKLYTEQQVRALLAGVSAPAAQARSKSGWSFEELEAQLAEATKADPENCRAVGEELLKSIHDNFKALKAAGWDGPVDSPVEVVTDLLNLLDEAKASAPQAQADARDADGEAFRTAARLGLTLRFYGNCAQSGMPGAPSVYEVTPGPNNAEAMRASIARADAAIAAQAAQQGDAA